MGRIDEALLLSNLDAGQDTGAAAAAAEPAPWLFEQHEGRDGRTARIAFDDNEPAERPAEYANAVPVTTSPRTGGYDGEAIQRLLLARTVPPLLVEQFRSLAATLHQAQRERPLKAVIVTSPSPGDGKTNVAVNLALTLSDSYRRRVLLIDADLRRPSLHLLLSVPNTNGLNEALKAHADAKLETVAINDRLTVLPAGRPESNPLGGLSSDRMKRIIEDAASRFDWVIVDSPPVGVLADARLVSEIVDGALLVVRAGVTRFEDVDAAADTIGHERILGIVLNAVDPAEIRSKDYYQQYYDRGVQER